MRKTEIFNMPSSEPSEEPVGNSHDTHRISLQMGGYGTMSGGECSKQCLECCNVDAVHSITNDASTSTAVVTEPTDIINKDDTHISVEDISELMYINISGIDAVHYLWGAAGEQFKTAFETKPICSFSDRLWFDRDFKKAKSINIPLLQANFPGENVSSFFYVLHLASRYMTTRSRRCCS